MRTKAAWAVVILLLIHLSAAEAEDKFGIGLKAGINKLEGDWKEPRFNSMGSFFLSYSPIPYFTVGAEVNSSILRTREKNLYFLGNLLYYDPNAYTTSALPLELDFRFNFAPHATVNPFAGVGFGGLMWKAVYDGKIIRREGEDQQGMAMFFKTSGGLEFSFDNGLSLLVGADFRYTGIDLLDQNPNGDENDGITSIWGGISYSIRSRDPEDLDRDGVPLKYDADPNRPEDKNGFWDHDGKPDYGRAGNRKGPRVIHYPIQRAEAGKDVEIKAVVTSPVPIKIVAVIYRTSDTSKWKILQLAKEADQTTYKGILCGDYLKLGTLEYCIIAVDQTMKGIGYSGLPKKPIVMKVERSGTGWRIVTGIVALLGWGGAAYIVMRKQNINE
ncbi:MAG: porin family protein [candidate division KSB1 bacterium]|nr:porin family protein [candidate division KSB1 bacterium]